MKKLILALSLVVFLFGAVGCKEAPVEPQKKGGDEVLGGEIEAYVFFATDAHYAVNTPAFTEVWVDNKLIGILTGYIAPESVLLDSVRQCNPNYLYPYVVIQKVNKPKDIKYQFITKTKSDETVVYTAEGKLSIDKSNNYNVFHSFARIK